MLTTTRLRLIPLTSQQLIQLLEAPAALEADLGLRLSGDVLTERVRRAIRMKLDKMGQAPLQDHPWYTYWLIVVNGTNFGAGLAGYKGLQDGKAELEIGYGIDPAYQGKGYTTEAVHALIAWAFSDPDCQRVVARETLKSNLASLRVLQKAGMRVFAESEEAYWLGIDR